MKHTVKAISMISTHEVHVYSLKFNVGNRFIEVKDILHKLFRIESLNQGVCIKASYFKRNYKLPEIDSLILATAVCYKYDHFYTFDKDFKELDNKMIEKTLIHYLE